MKKSVLVLSLFSLLLAAGRQTGSKPISTATPGNIADGIYTIVGDSSHRCVEVPNSSCASKVALQTFDCDKSGASNNQKFNVVSDGRGNYTISPVHSDLCLEVASEKYGDHIPIIQVECEKDKAGQKWSMSQYGLNLEIRDVLNNQCLDVERKAKSNFSPINLSPCSNGTNQRWRLSQATVNVDTGIICRSSTAHPERECDGVNDQQKTVHLGKTLTKARCEDVCRVNRMVSCRWAGANQ